MTSCWTRLPGVLTFQPQPDGPGHVTTIMITEEMIHGCLPRSVGSRQHRRFCSIRRARRPHQRASLLPLWEPQGSGEWDASARQFEEIQRRCHEAGEMHRPPWPTRIEDDTPIVPRAVAERVCEEASLWLGEPFPREWGAELAERANVVYQHNARFRQLLRKRGDAGIYWLAAFMRHWLCGLLASRRPDLRQRLPGSYAVGQDLPSATPAPDAGEGRRMNAECRMAGQSRPKPGASQVQARYMRGTSRGIATVSQWAWVGQNA